MLCVNTFWAEPIDDINSIFIEQRNKSKGCLKLFIDLGQFKVYKKNVSQDKEVVVYG